MSRTPTSFLDRDRAFIIAEAGTCHASHYKPFRRDRAFTYVAAAKQAGADAVKFQVFHAPSPQTIFCWMDGDEERVARWRNSVLTFENWKDIKALAEDMDLVFLASVFEHETVEWLNELKVAATKVASRAARDFPYGKSPAPYFVSNGMYVPPLRDDVIILQCEANYPSSTRWSGKLLSYEPPFGFSDHSGHPIRAIDALARGCKLLEVHYFIEESDAGPDLPASLTVDQLRLVCQARDVLAETP